MAKALSLSLPSKARSSAYVTVSRATYFWCFWTIPSLALLNTACLFRPSRDAYLDQRGLNANCIESWTVLPDPRKSENQYLEVTVILWSMFVRKTSQFCLFASQRQVKTCKNKWNPVITPQKAGSGLYHYDQHSQETSYCCLLLPLLLKANIVGGMFVCSAHNQELLPIPKVRPFPSLLAKGFLLVLLNQCHLYSVLDTTRC